ncbi:hypothetical protein [Pendulispora albinea]|uniref:Lipocalin-like domain-containing protein n=1 Tax=Pendulispora albinea TaxID=2741071 RepID=A0ABZ2M8R1_9BACT
MHKTLVARLSMIALTTVAGSALAADSAFVGHWTFQSGSKATTPCSAGYLDETGKAFDLTPGSAPGEFLSSFDGCTLTMVESDASHARLKNATSCTLSDGSTSYNVTFTSSTLVLDGSGVLSVELNGNSGICALTVKGTAIR